MTPLALHLLACLFLADVLGRWFLTAVRAWEADYDQGELP